MSNHAPDTTPMLASPRCFAKTRCGRPCRAPAANGKRRCRLHGGAVGSGAPKRNRNARTHGRFTKRASAERKKMRALVAEAWKFLREMK
jgi:glucans biosynthesis protein